MRKIEEKKGDGTYSVAYACDDNIIKVVRINEDDQGRAVGSAQLQIQRPGIEMSVEALEFENGRVAIRHTKSDSGGSSKYFLNNNSDDLERVLRQFGSEFKTVLKSPQIQPYWETHFEDILPHLQ